MQKSKQNIVSYKDKKTKLFFIFLLLSFLFWFLSKLSKEYTTTIPFNAVFVNQPKDKNIFITNDQIIYVTLKSSGFDLLKNSFKKNLKIDLSSAKIKTNKTIINTKEQTSKIRGQLGNDIQIIQTEPEIFEFNFGELNSKKVNITPNISLKYKSGYYLSEPLIIKPDSILISGPKEKIDSIDNIYTNEIKLTNLQNNFKKDITLISPKNKNIKLSTNKVTIIGKVEKNTEGEIILPFFIINTNGANIKTFEKEIKAKYKVSLNNYDKIKASDFYIICDYNKTILDSLDYLIPEIQKKSEYVSEVKITPNQIKFLIL
jgi:hypothetical protein